MSPRDGLSVLELQFFKDEIFRLAQDFKGILNTKEPVTLETTKFTDVKKVFEEMDELAQDLGATVFHKYFHDFIEILDYSVKANNERANKKVTLMCFDYLELLEGLAQHMNNKDRLKGILKAFEVLTFKQERLKRGEFYSFCRDEIPTPKKQRAV